MLRSPLLPIFLTVFVDVLGLTLMLPLLPFYAEHFGASPIMVDHADLQLRGVPAHLRADPRAALRSHRPQAGAARQPDGHVRRASSPSAPPTRLSMLFVGRMIDGLTAGNLSIAQAYISDVTRPENRTRSFALIGIAFGSGFLFGPAHLGELSHRLGLRRARLRGRGALVPLDRALGDAAARARPSSRSIKAEHGDAPGAAAARGARTLALGRFFSRPLPRRRLLQFFSFTTSFAVLTGGPGALPGAAVRLHRPRDGAGYTASPASWAA